METIQYSTPTASCGSCKRRIAGAFADEPGVESAVLDLETKLTAVTYDPSSTDSDAIVATLTAAGYEPAGTAS